jgi:NAD(P)H-dependent flavin oxidoreductase YrpB (nitropropane dioxygenase family)
VIRTPFTELVGVEHPVVCAGMGGGHTGGGLVGHVSEAGGLHPVLAAGGFADGAGGSAR